MAFKSRKLELVWKPMHVKGNDDCGVKRAPENSQKAQANFCLWVFALLTPSACSTNPKYVKADSLPSIKSLLRCLVLSEDHWTSPWALPVLFPTSHFCPPENWPSSNNCVIYLSLIYYVLFIVCTSCHQFTHTRTWVPRGQATLFCWLVYSKYLEQCLALLINISWMNEQMKDAWETGAEPKCPEAIRFLVDYLFQHFIYRWGEMTYPKSQSNSAPGFQQSWVSYLLGQFSLNCHHNRKT